MSLSREVYSDGGGSWSRYSSVNLWKEPPEARHHKEKEEENATRCIWVFTWTTGTKTAARWKALRETWNSCSCGRSKQKEEETDAPEQYKQTGSKKEKGS